jgi:hypothetical protein
MSYQRLDRSLISTFEIAPSSHLQCVHVIRLYGQDYRCKRHHHEQGGVHDAMCRAADGYLVRW